MSCVPTRKDGVPEFVIKAIYVMQWCIDTISEITSAVIYFFSYMDTCIAIIMAEAIFVVHW